MELHELLEKVDGPESFLEFVRMLQADKLAEVGNKRTLSGAGQMAGRITRLKIS